MTLPEKIALVVLAPFAAVAGALWGIACFAVGVAPFIIVLMALGFIK